MPIGDTLAIRFGSSLKGQLMRALGKPEIHDHLRLAPMVAYFASLPEMQQKQPLRILEVGCDNGLNGFELNKINPSITYEGFDLNQQSIGHGSEIAMRLGIEDRFRFYCRDATLQGGSPYADETYDFILLMDFLEHVTDPEKILTKLQKKCHQGTRFVVSVPTHRYPRIFGRKMHLAIGHVRDGFSFEELSELFQPFALLATNIKYTTGILTSMVCFLNYRIRLPLRPLELLKNMVFYPFRFFDWGNGSKVSCSLFAVFSRPTDPLKA